MNKHLTLIRKAQKRFRIINKHLFDGCLPKIQIEVKASSKDFDGTFVSFTPPEDGKPYIILYKDLSDEILIHEMIHFYLYTIHLPGFMLSAKRPRDATIFRKKYAHTKEFWEIHKEIMAKLI